MGIIVSSENGRKDYIYNHLKRASKLTFTGVSFTEDYGIVSYQKNEPLTLFLRQGKMIEKGQYKIETKDDLGAVLVSFTVPYAFRQGT